MIEDKGQIVYQRLDNGIEIYDAEHYNKPMIDCARNVSNAFLVTAIFLGLLVIVFVVIPFATDLVHSGMCYAAPNWPVKGGCP